MNNDLLYAFIRKVTVSDYKRFMGTDCMSQRSTLYESIANQWMEKIRTQQYAYGQRLPGTRQMAKLHEVSINTILNVQKVLESQGYIRAIERSGFFVCWQPTIDIKNTLVKQTSFFPSPKPVKHQKIVQALLQATQQHAILPLGAALPSSDFYPIEALKKSASKVIRRSTTFAKGYSFPPGEFKLRAILKNRLSLANCHLDEDDWVITNGCHEAIILALKAVTKPGEIVALESPTYFGLLQALDSLQLKALEIPTHPEQGIEIEALEEACHQWPIKACVLVTHFSNPLGSCLSTGKKQKLLSLLNKNNIPLIEDDVYGDLAFDGHRPPPIKSFDEQGMVLYCGSFSKTVTPNLRVGWIAAGQFNERIKHLKFTHSLASSSLEQDILAHFLEYGHYDRHIRKLQSTYRNLVLDTREHLIKYFPMGTLVSLPKGGFVLWITLPARISAMSLYEKALQHNISISPGELFTTSRKYRNAFRINCAHTWSAQYEKALELLGHISHQLLD